MNCIYCIKYSKFTKTNNIKINGKFELYFCCVGCGFKKVETVDKDEIRYLLKVETI